MSQTASYIITVFSLSFKMCLLTFPFLESIQLLKALQRGLHFGYNKRVELKDFNNCHNPSERIFSALCFHVATLWGHLRLKFIKDIHSKG